MIKQVNHKKNMPAKDHFQSKALPYNLELTEVAQNDLEAILSYTALEWSGQQADIYFAVIEKGLQMIQGNPDLGRAKHGISERIKGYKAGKHIIFYRLEGRTVYVIRILHGSMNYPTHLDL